MEVKDTAIPVQSARVQGGTPQEIFVVLLCITA